MCTRPFISIKEEETWDQLLRLTFSGDTTVTRASSVGIFSCLLLYLVLAYFQVPSAAYFPFPFCLQDFHATAPGPRLLQPNHVPALFLEGSHEAEPPQRAPNRLFRCWVQGVNVGIHISCKTVHSPQRTEVLTPKQGVENLRRSLFSDWQRLAFLRDRKDESKAPLDTHPPFDGDDVRTLVAWIVFVNVEVLHASIRQNTHKRSRFPRVVRQPSIGIDSGWK